MKTNLIGLAGLAVMGCAAVPNSGEAPTIAADASAALGAVSCEREWLVGDIRPAPGERAEALAMSDGRFIAVGGVDLVEASGDPDACVTTLPEGAAAFAGLVDGHAHLAGIGFRELNLNLDDVTSIAQLQARIAEAAVDGQPGEPLEGRGWIETGWPEGRMPTRDDLDAVVSDRPVILSRSDGHAAVVNSAALDAVGVDADTPDPEGGRIVRDATGRATGLLIDRAEDLMQPLVAEPSEALRKQALKLGAETYAARGWVGVHNMSVRPLDAKLLEELAEAGELPLRVVNYLEPYALDQMVESGPVCVADKRVCHAGLKFYADGALGSRGALLLADYSDEPGTRGLQLIQRKEATIAFERARDAGLQIATHAIGDLGNRLVLNWYGEVLADTEDHRWRIEHSQIVSPDDLARFADGGVIASMQPSHAIGDLFFAPSRLGDDRLDGAYAWSTLLADGAVVVGGSDAPVEQGDPRIELHAAVNRASLDGFQGPDWRAEEALPPEDALAIFTTLAAYSVGMEDELGRIAPGYRADLTIFSADPFTTPWDEVEVVQTYIDGAPTQ